MQIVDLLDFSYLVEAIWKLGLYLLYNSICYCTWWCHALISLVSRNMKHYETKLQIFGAYRLNLEFPMIRNEVEPQRRIVDVSKFKCPDGQRIRGFALDLLSDLSIYHDLSVLSTYQSMFLFHLILSHIISSYHIMSQGSGLTQDVKSVDRSCCSICSFPLPLV